MAAVFCWAFFEPHVVVDRGGDQISPPVVAQLVGKEVAVGKGILLDHRPWVGDVGGDFQGAVRGEDVANAFPGVGPPPMFECIDGEAEVGKFGLHQTRVVRLARQTHGNVPKRACVHVIVVDIRSDGNGAQVRWDGVVQFPRAEQSVSAQRHLFD